eukprot:sb/3479242/
MIIPILVLLGLSTAQQYRPHKTPINYEVPHEFICLHKEREIAKPGLYASGREKEVNREGERERGREKETGAKRTTFDLIGSLPHLKKDTMKKII